MTAGSRASLTLDPDDWDEFRVHAHAALDDMVDMLRNVREAPVWRPVPPDVAERLRTAAPEMGQGLERAMAEFRRDILPYPTGNIHPRFWAWVSGSGSPVGMVADLLAAGMNSYNLGFDDSAAVRVELQVLDWFKELFGLPKAASGLIVSGGSMANLIGLAVGRTATAGFDVRRQGANATGYRGLTLYASTETHSSIQKGVELLGLGSDNIRWIAVDENYQIDAEALTRAIHADVRAGLRPAIVVGNAGTVNTGAIDDLEKLADIARAHEMWFHVDGAFGAIAALMPEPPSRLRGMEHADSLAFDLHKWLHQPYSGGVVIVRNPELHAQTFRVVPPYLDRLEGGLAGGPTDFSALGLQLSRSFAALRVWLTFKTHGVGRFRELVVQNVAQAKYLESRIRAHSRLELLAPTSLNIVNYRYNPANLPDEALAALNKKLLVQLQARGIAAPSSTRLHETFAIRVCITNHRSRLEDFETLVTESVRIGDELSRHNEAYA